MAAGKGLHAVVLIVLIAAMLLPLLIHLRQLYFLVPDILIVKGKALWVAGVSNPSRALDEGV